MINFEKLNGLIGNTPLVKINYEFENKKRYMYAKLEWYNLSGSIKDRPALEIIKNAYKLKQLKQGQEICETTSGNMGISLSAIGKFTHNPVVICMPKFMSMERQKLILSYGAKLILTDSFEDAFKVCEERGKDGAFLPRQFENQYNSYAHYKSTATEILNKLDKVPCFISGVGTGGTLMGIGKHLKQRLNTKIIALDPKESSLLTYGKSKGKHKIQGLSDGIIPKLYDEKLVDKIIQIKSDDAIKMAQKLCKDLGLGVGISSGANFLGCVLSNHNGSLTVFADDNKKYLSTDLTSELQSKLVDNIKLISYEVV